MRECRFEQILKRYSKSYWPEFVRCVQTYIRKFVRLLIGCIELEPETYSRGL